MKTGIWFAIFFLTLLLLAGLNWLMTSYFGMKPESFVYGLIGVYSALMANTLVRD
jgi:hypothetical protein